MLLAKFDANTELYSDSTHCNIPIFELDS